MLAIFIHVAAKDLNFTTVSKDFITYIFSVICPAFFSKHTQKSHYSWKPTANKSKNLRIC
jgi:hypothetical protein